MAQGPWQLLEEDRQALHELRAVGRPEIQALLHLPGPPLDELFLLGLQQIRQVDRRVCRKGHTKLATPQVVAISVRS